MRRRKSYLRAKDSRGRFRACGEHLESRLPLAGDFAGVLTLGGTGFDHVIDTAIDAAGNQYVAGEFNATASFEQTQLTSVGSSDGYVAKYDSAGSLLWARGFGGTSTDRLNSLALSDTGEVYVGGYFSGTVDFDPGSGTHEQTASGPRDAYLLSLTGDGDFNWVRTFGGNSVTDVRGIALGNGGIYLAGSFARATDFDPGPTELLVSSNGNLDAYVAHYSTSGAFLWAKTFGGLQPEIAEQIAVADSGNVIVAGTYRGETDFDPGPGDSTLIANGGNDLFVSSFDSSGTHQWAIGVGADGSESVNGLALDSNGSIYTTGAFFETVDFDPGPGGASQHAGDNSAAYVWKLNSLGGFEWVTSYDGSVFDSAVGWSIAVDNFDQLFAAGSLFGTVFFEGSPVTTFGGNDPYLVKLDSATGALDYVRHYGGIFDELPLALTTDSNGSVFTGGYFQGRTDFDPGEGVQNRDSAGSSDGFLLQLVDQSPTETRVAGRHLFYNRSHFDGNNPTANSADDNAIAPDKTALLPGQTASFANYSSYSRGLNGVMVDIANLANPGGLLASDFTFRSGNSQSIASWINAPPPTEISVRSGVGLLGSDRVTLIFADGAIKGQWLEVTVLANANTGLAAPDTFYFGNSIGETGNSSGTQVDASDYAATRVAEHTFLNPATMTSKVDFNRDRLVDAADLLLVRDNTTDLASALVLLAPPANANKHSIAAASPVLTESDLKQASRRATDSKESSLAADQQEAIEASSLDAFFAEYAP